MTFHSARNAGKVASGFQDARNRRTAKIAVTFDRLVFERIRRRALADGVSVGAVVRRLVDKGMEGGGGELGDDPALRATD